MREKENALQEYFNMIKESWTFNRMTEKEKERVFDALRFAKLKGTFFQRWEQLQAVYYGFLLGLGYTSTGWRETDPEVPLF